MKEGLLGDTLPSVHTEEGTKGGPSSCCTLGSI
jgi:hypothetical protein